MMCRLALNIPSYVEEGPVRARPPRLSPLTREEFVSKKLAPKLQQQLKVPHLSKLDCATVAVPSANTMPELPCCCAMG